MKVNLVFPPYWSFATPYLAIPALVGHLKHRGVEARFIDLNIKAVNRLFSSAFMDECVGRIEERLAKVPNAIDDATGTPIGYYLTVADIVSPRLEACKDTLRRESLPHRVKPARNVLDHAMEVVSAAFSPARIDRIRYDYQGIPIADFALARRLSADGATNIFGSLIERQDMEELLDGNPDLVGLSLTGVHQLVPALTLVTRLKAAAPEVPIVVGGAVTLYLYELARKRPDLFEGIDFMVIGEGETALAHLLQAMAGRRSMESIENLFFRVGTEFVAGKLGHIEDVEALSPPDFEGAPWDMYLAPKRIVPYLTSRGCYWDKCSFCSLCATFMNQYRERSIVKVINDLRYLADTERIDQCFFTDECFSPKRLRAFSRALLNADLKLGWDILARFEAPFRAADFDLAAKAGLNWITWGLESASPRVLELMNKGIDPASAGRLLRDAGAAGIWNNVFVIFGFPGETEEDYLLTKSFVRQNAAHIDSLAYTNFRLEKGAAIYRNGAKHGLVRLEMPDTFFGPAFPFNYVPPLDHECVAHRLDDFEAFLRRETHLSMLFTEGLSPATLKLALQQFSGKTELTRMIREQAEYFRGIFLGQGWLAEERFVRNPYSRYDGHLKDGSNDSEKVEDILLAETTGRIVAVNAAASKWMELFEQGFTLPAVIRLLLERAPTEADLVSALPFLRHLLWRGLIEPLGSGGLAPPHLVEPDYFESSRSDTFAYPNDPKATTRLSRYGATSKLKSHTQQRRNP